MAVKQAVVGALVAAVACVGVIALILILVHVSSLELPTGTQYGMVFDAGSTHTSLFMYRWPGGKENNTGVVSQVLVCDVEGPGISSYAGDPPGAGRSLRACLDMAQASIPADRQQSAPIYLGATAGMRLLHLQSPGQSLKVLEEVSRSIRSYPFDFRGARIISGEEEGAYGWITINYLLEGFIKYTFDGEWKHPKSGEIQGALDLGGASTQITFEPQTSILQPQTKADFRLYGYNYSVYTYSYLCYGKEQAMRQLQVALLQGKNLSKPVTHPCYPSGYKLTMTMSDLFNSPCVSKPSSIDPVTSVTFSGSSDSGECHTLVRKIFNLSDCASAPQCGFNGVYQPNVTGRFFAFSAYFYTFSFLKLTPQAPLARVLSTTEQICGRNWTWLQAQYPGQKEQYLRDYCAAAHYITTLLLDGYKFNNSTWNNIIFQGKAAGTDIGWTLGYMLNLTNLIPAERPPEVVRQQRDQWAAASFFIVLSIFLSLLALAVQIWNLITKGKGGAGAAD
ncbi:ectonucleoside triphosphate diphosphohydrolase 8 isoform X2 [Amia ocellicauda]|nr:ENTP8 diphosphohydrolase [Amia calva]